MKKSRVLSLVLLLTACVMLCVSAGDTFLQIENYVYGHFKDVTEKDWFAKDVESAYKLGFMDGTADDTFSPNGSVTVAQGITMAARVNAIYNNEDIPKVDGEWYQMYVDYAMANGIITDGQFDNLSRNIKRIEMAKLLYDAMPEGYYVPINEVEEIPDVPSDEKYAQEIMALYKAGIVFGSDEYGFFHPTTDLKRSESAAIINRVALSENRVKGTLVKFVDESAYLLADDDSVNNPYMSEAMSSKPDSRDVINSGWIYDNRGGPIRLINKASYSTLVDISEEYGSALIRELSNVDTGKVVIETSLKVDSNGVFLELQDKEGNPVYNIKTIDNAWSILLADGTYKKILENAFSTRSVTFNFRIVLDLDNMQSATYINDKYLGTSELLSDNIQNFRFAIDEKSTGKAYPGSLKIYVNYIQNENFDMFENKEVYGWESSGSVYLFSNELNLIGESSVQQSLEKSEGRIAANVTFLNRDNDDFEYILLGEDREVVKVSVVGGKFMIDGKEVYSLSTKLWYRLRLDVNTETCKANVLLNGRSIGEIGIPANSCIDTMRILNISGTNKFDDFQIFKIMDYPNYVPVPETKASKDDYVVGINVCSLWKVGTHKGWSCITPFEEREPVLGYYDEGSPETADWEIKFFVEHGIDFQAFCWYPGSGALKNREPLKNGGLHSQLHDGYMYSKYSDYMDYCIIWEASGKSQGIWDSEYFREFVIPYWFENYFLDPRYLKLDNKIVLCVFSGDNLSTTSYFGSNEAVKKEMEYLDEVAKSYGFDGVVTLATGTPLLLEREGIEAVYSYGWGSEGKTFEKNVGENLRKATAKGSFAIPVVTPGFDSIPWHTVRYGRISESDWEKLQNWVVNEFLPEYKRTEEEWKWTNNLVFVSTWNEYGEGSYLMPDHDVGFKFLDTLRDYYTNLPKEHEDVIPNEAQKERINKAFPQNQIRLIPSGWHKYNFEDTIPEENFEIIHKIDFSDGNDYIYELYNAEINSKVKDPEGLPLVVTEIDPQLCIYDEMFDTEDIDYLRITLDAPVSSIVKVYWSVNDAEYIESKHFKTTLEEDGWQSVLLPTVHDKWLGTLTSVRIDVDAPTVIGSEYQIKSVEYLKYKPEAGAHLFIDNIEIVSEVPNQYKDGVVYSPFDHQTSIHYILDGVYSYNRKTKTFKFNANHHELEFVVGTDKYKVDGEQKELGYTLEMYDGVPMFDFASFAKDLGYEVTVDGQNVHIKTTQSDMVKYVLDESSGKWEFNLPDSEAWSSTNLTLSVSDGLLKAVSTESGKIQLDPYIVARNLSFEAEKYKALEVRLKYKYDADAKEQANQMQLYFMTKNERSLDKNNVVSLKLDSADSGENFEVYTFDLSENKKWTDIITYLRFDPFESYGEVEIDYIRLVENSQYDVPEIVRADDIPATVVNGNAQGSENLFHSGDGAKNVTIQTLDDGNRVYQASSDDNKMVHPVTFGNKKTYKISYDVRILGNNTENAENADYTALISCNLRYYDKTINLRGKSDHVVQTTPVKVSDGWVNVSFECTVENLITIITSDVLLSAESTDKQPVVFQMDNFVITEK